MKKIITLFFCLFFAFGSNSLHAQLSLSGEAASTLDKSGDRVIQLIRTEDAKAIMPTMETCGAIISDIPYTSFEMRKRNLANLESNYATQVQDMTTNLANIKQEATERGIDWNNVTVTDVQMEVEKSYELLQGGNAKITFRSGDGKEYQLLVKALYFIGEEWYVMNKIILL